MSQKREARKTPLMMPKPWERLRTAGATYVEYLLIAFLILMLSVAGWMAIGKGFNGVASKLKDEFKHKSDLAIAANGTGVSSGPTVTGGLNGSSGSSGPPILSCDVLNHQCVVQAPPPFTLGGNGNDMQAAFMDWMISFLRALGINVPTDPNKLIVKLAQSGHKVAFLQKVMEALNHYSAKDVTRMKDTQVVIEGKSYKVQELVDMLNDLTTEVQQQQESVSNSSLPPETVSQTEQNTQTIVDSSQQTVATAQNTLNQDPNAPTTSTTATTVVTTTTATDASGTVIITTTTDPTGMSTTSTTAVSTTSTTPTTTTTTSTIVAPVSTTTTSTTDPNVPPPDSTVVTTTTTTSTTDSSSSSSGNGGSGSSGSTTSTGGGSGGTTPGSTVSDDAATSTCNTAADPTPCRTTPPNHPYQQIPI
jgi:hypothetical protein